MLKYHIQTIEVPAGGSSTITFTNIPQTYDDLLVAVSARCSSAGNNGALLVSVNGDNAYSNGASRWIQGNGSAGSSSSATFAVSGIINGAGSTANTFSNGSFYISNYTLTSQKAISQEWVTEENASQAFQRVTAGVSTIAQAITSLSLITDNPNFVQYSSASLYGIKRGADGVTQVPAAFGGTVTTSGGYTIHTFTSSGTFTANRSLETEYLVVAGGGGGGADDGGGGGAGGYRTATGFAVSAGSSHVVTVGAGGAGATSISNSGAKGSDSVFSTITSTGGGGGKSRSSGVSNSAGGSGGGGSYLNPTAGLGIAGQGFDGGTGRTDSNSGGGGGAGSVGGNAVGSSGPGGNGGAGLTSSITGTPVTRAGGGGGGNGGLGSAGGGNGSDARPSFPAPSGFSASANSGSGGGGQGNSGNYQGGNGGSGIVIIRYLTPA